MPLMGIHLALLAALSFDFAQRSSTGKQNFPEIWAAQTRVFDSNSKKNDFNVCIKQRPVCNGTQICTGLQCGAMEMQASPESETLL